MQKASWKKGITISIHWLFIFIITFAWMLFLFLPGEYSVILPKGIGVFGFYLFFGIISVYLVSRKIGFKKENWKVLLPSFFSVPFIFLISKVIHIKRHRWAIVLLFISAILFWHLEVVYIIRASIGSQECAERVTRHPFNLGVLGRTIEYYQEKKGVYPLTLPQLYEDKDARTSLFDILTLGEAESRYRYLPPKNHPVEEKILAYERKPIWHFHSFAEGRIFVPVYVLNLQGGVFPGVAYVSVPKSRFGGNLRKIFFWYFIGTPFKGSEEITPEEIQRYYEKQKGSNSYQGYNQKRSNSAVLGLGSPGRTIIEP